MGQKYDWQRGGQMGTLRVQIKKLAEWEHRGTLGALMRHDEAEGRGQMGAQGQGNKKVAQVASGQA